MSRTAVPRRTFAFICQVYVPDPTSVGQHFADAAAELASRGHRVIVLTADRGYEDTARHYPRRESINGVDVRRLPWSSFGKGRTAWRLLAGLSFTVQATVRALRIRNLDAVVVSTLPPVGVVSAVVLGALRSVRVTFWVMDLNPDQAVAMGVMRPGSVPVRLLEWAVRRLLRGADDVVVLDRFMAERVGAKADVSGRLVVLPPWPLDDHLEPVPHLDNPFRRTHGWQDRFVVMYSGNHSPANPIDTLVATARAMREESRVVFAFVGGGSDKRKVEEAGLPNVVSLPYQPLDLLRYSLSAADLHVVTVGSGMVGIVHPCKVYGAMAVARPVLSFGPPEGHVVDLLRAHAFGWSVRHGDVDGAVSAVRAALDAPPEERAAMGERGRALVQGGLGKHTLCGRFCDLVERRVLSVSREDDKEWGCRASC